MSALAGFHVGAELRCVWFGTIQNRTLPPVARIYYGRNLFLHSMGRFIFLHTHFAVS